MSTAIIFQMPKNMLSKRRLETLIKILDFAYDLKNNDEQISLSVSYNKLGVLDKFFESKSPSYVSLKDMVEYKYDGRLHVMENRLNDKFYINFTKKITNLAKTLDKSLKV